MRCLTATLIFAALILGAVLPAFAADVIHSGSWGGLMWELNETTGHMIISGEGKMEKFTHSSKSAWHSFKTSIKTATIEDGVTSIGDYAFYYCKNLTSVEIPNSVTAIGDDAFSYCESLTGVNIPNGVTEIGASTFYDCGLTNVKIPNSVTSINEYAFANCRKMTSIEIPNSVTSIGNWAFSWCESLTSFEIPNRLTDIGDYAFAFCSRLTSLYYCNTEEQWNKIKKGENWDKSTGDYTFYFHETHTWDSGEITSLPTHTTVGTRTYTCADCNATETEESPKLTEHTYGNWAKKNDQQHQKLCECGDVQYGDHEWNSGEITVPPSHTSAGVKTYTCADCNATKSEDIAKLTEHTYGDWTNFNEQSHQKLCECGDAKFEDHTYTSDTDTDCEVCGFVRALNTNEPITDEPNTDKPGIDLPTTDEPNTDVPATNEPTTDEPIEIFGCNVAGCNFSVVIKSGCNSSAAIGRAWLFLLAIGSAGLLLKKKEF